MANPDDTYERLRSLEAWLSNLYKDAEDDLREKWDAFMEKHEAAAGNLKAKVATAATAEERKQAEERYQAYLRSATTGNRYYREMIAETAKQFAVVNQRAVEIVNGERSSFYSGGYNLSAGEINDVAIKQGVGIRFDMCSAEAVDWLAENRGRINLPPAKTLNYTEDERWSAKLLNSQVAQGIVQGESIPKIAGRISNVTGAEQASAVRAARTMATECQNAGRVQAMENATANGVKTKKRWICTHDPRTRDTHLELDGEMEDPDGVFWNGCRWPGDHLGPPEETWNCRCALGTEIVGFASNLPKGKEVAVHVTIDGKEVQQESQKQEHVVAQGTDITAEWHRRPDEFDFEIKDVMNAQGFDGTPRIVSAEEFDAAVKAANGGEGFVAQRTYVAPDQKTLDSYRDMLYNGDWYVDCSVGGAQYGQGMYCAADYSGTLTEGISEEMRHYIELGKQRNGDTAKAYIETLTLDPSARIIKYDDLVALWHDYKWAAEVERKDQALEAAIIQMGATPDKKTKKLFSDILDLYSSAYTKKQIETFEKKLAKANLQRSDVGKIQAVLWAESRRADTTIKDIGSYAAALGYDVINAEGHGASGSYTVVLNRTKLIIREPN